MKTYEIKEGSSGMGGLRRAERPDPQAGPQQVLIRIRAASLNYRDHMALMGTYFTPVERPTTPLSDGAGEVVSVGEGVTRFKPGDRVAGTFLQVWKDGPRPARAQALGVPLDGTLAEYIALHEEGVVALPSNLSFNEAATLPCAGVTAWNALMVAGRQVRPGDTFVCLRTGGVSIMAAQFAHATGARVIVTSSSDNKFQRALSLGASHGINYNSHPAWEKEVERISGGGADCVIEIGGAGSLPHSYRALGFGGKIALIGFLAGPGDPNPMPLMMKGASLHGIGVGSTRMFEDMNRAIEINGIKPPVDKVFPFDEAPEAFRCLASRDFVGKIVIFFP